MPPQPTLNHEDPGVSSTPVDDADQPDRRSGQLTFGWRLATVGMWALVFVAFTGVWKASRELGLATWWLGPFGAPQPIVVMLVPFVLPSAMVVAGLNNARGLPWLGIGAGLVTVAIGAGDLDRVGRLGLVEIGLGVAAIGFSVATASGRYRQRR